MTQTNGRIWKLIVYAGFSVATLETIIKQKSEQDWETSVTTEFGSKTKAESLGRIIFHTAHHGGQLAIILEYVHAEIKVIIQKCRINT